MNALGGKLQRSLNGEKPGELANHYGWEKSLVLDPPQMVLAPMSPVLSPIASLPLWLSVPVFAGVGYAPQPLACILRSGITSRSKCASFSISQMSWSKAGPRRPAVKMLVLSATGAPVALVNGFSFDLISPQFRRVCTAVEGLT
jgi:hypothetical protein